MGENDDSSIFDSFAGVVAIGVLWASAIGMFTLGPIDAARVAYNSFVGDTPLIRARATEYCRTGIQRRYPMFSAEQVESVLAGDLKYSRKAGERVNPQEVRMMELLDATEDYARSTYERWVWPSFQ